MDGANRAESRGLQIYRNIRLQTQDSYLLAFEVSNYYAHEIFGFTPAARTTLSYRCTYLSGLTSVDEFIVMAGVVALQGRLNQDGCWRALHGATFGKTEQL
jgi:hypothetical protein